MDSALVKMEKRVEWLSAIPGFWAMFTIGVASSIIGPSLPVLVDMYGLSWAEAGQVFSAQFGGKLAAVVFLSAWEWRRLARPITATGGALLCLGLFLAALSPGWLATLAAIVVFGLGHGLVDAGYNAVFANMDWGSDAAHAGRWLNKLHVLFGVGALAGPLLVSAMAYDRPWWGAFAAAALFALVIPFTALWRHNALHKNIAGINTDTLNTGATQTNITPSDTSRTTDVKLRNWTAINTAVAALVCYLYGGIETSLGGWIYTILTEGAYLSGDVAALSVTAFWALLMAGRLASVWGITRVGALRWVFILSSVLVCSLAAAISLNAYGIAATVVVVAGFGLSGIFSTVIAWVASTLSRPSAKVVAWLIGSGALGAISVPLLVGAMADWRGVMASLTGLLLLAVLLMGAVLYLLRREAKKFHRVS